MEPDTTNPRSVTCWRCSSTGRVGEREGDGKGSQHSVAVMWLEFQLQEGRVQLLFGGGGVRAIRCRHRTQYAKVPLSLYTSPHQTNLLLQPTLWHNLVQIPTTLSSGEKVRKGSSWTSLVFPGRGRGARPRKLEWGRSGNQDAGAGGWSGGYRFQKGVGSS